MEPGSEAGPDSQVFDPPAPLISNFAASWSATFILPSSVIHLCCPRHKVYLASTAVLVIIFKNSEPFFPYFPFCYFGSPGIRRKAMLMVKLLLFLYNDSFHLLAVHKLSI